MIISDLFFYFFTKSRTIFGRSGTILGPKRPAKRLFLGGFGLEIKSPHPDFGGFLIAVSC